MSKIKVNEIEKASGSGITVPTGSTFTVTDGIAQASIADQAINEAKLQISNAPTNGYFLSAQSGNTGGLTWAEAGGGGKVLQAVTATYSTPTTQTSNSYATSGLTASITPASSSNKVLVLTSSAIQSYGDGQNSSGRVCIVGLFRGTVSGTKIQEHKSGVSMASGTTSTNDHSYENVSFVVLDSPSTTSAQAYTVGISGSGAGEALAQGDNNTSTITLLEIAG